MILREQKASLVAGGTVLECLYLIAFVVYVEANIF